MALTMDQLKDAFKKRTDSQSSSSGSWDKFFPFYKMNFGEIAAFRFLPDLDENNPWAFVVENKYHEFTINGKKKRVACLHMYGEDCPACEMSSKFYSDGDKTMGKTFWRKIDYLASGLVVSSPFEFKISDDNPNSLISLGPKLFEIVEAALIQGDFDQPPYDLIDGCDFRIAKTQQGEYASYTTSAFARKSSPIDQETLGKIKLLDLKSYRYAKTEKAAMEAMIESVLTGRAFDDKKAAEDGAPPVMKEPAPLQSAPAPVAAPVAAAPAAAPEAAAPTSGRAAEILARLRRTQATAA